MESITEHRQAHIYTHVMLHENKNIHMLYIAAQTPTKVNVFSLNSHGTC